MADEPTGNLDGATGVEVADLMFRLNREHGTTLVLVTHDLSLASRCGRRLSLSAGRLVGDERPRRSDRAIGMGTQLGVNTLRLALRMLRRDWRAGELRVLDRRAGARRRAAWAPSASSPIA